MHTWCKGVRISLLGGGGGYFNLGRGAKREINKEKIRLLLENVG